MQCSGLPTGSWAARPAGSRPSSGARTSSSTRAASSASWVTYSQAVATASGKVAGSLPAASQVTVESGASVGESVRCGVVGGREPAVRGGRHAAEPDVGSPAAEPDLRRLRRERIEPQPVGPVVVRARRRLPPEQRADQRAGPRRTAPSAPRTGPRQHGSPRATIPGRDRRPPGRPRAPRATRSPWPARPDAGPRAARRWSPGSSRRRCRRRSRARWVRPATGGATRGGRWRTPWRSRGRRPGRVGPQLRAAGKTLAQVGQRQMHTEIHGAHRLPRSAGR